MKYLFSVVFIISLAVSSLGCANTFHIDSNFTGTGCTCQYYSSSLSFECTCKTLEDALVQVSPQCTQTSANYDLMDDLNQANNASVLWPDIITIVGRNINTLIVCTGSDVGWNFFNLVSVVIQNITFVNCSSSRPSTTRDPKSNNSMYTYNFKVALYFDLCGSITMTNVTVLIDTTADVTGVVMYNPSTVNVEDCLFIGSQDPSANNSSRRGGGFVLELTSCAPGTVAPECVAVTMKPTSVFSYTFTGCVFANNSALSSTDSARPPMDPAFGMEYNSFGRGGGLSVIVKKDFENLVFKIIKCKFDGNFAQYHGGGLFVSFLDHTHGNSIAIQNSDFLGNSCPFSLSPSSGGGIHIENLIYDKQPVVGSNWIDSWSGNAFHNNSAYTGGGLFIRSVTSAFMMSSENCPTSCSMYDTIFSSNLAVFGSAVYVQHFQTLYLQNGHHSALGFDRCVFSDNDIHRDSGDNSFSQSGLGTVFSDQNDLWFQSSVRFENNTGSALAMMSAVANFSGCNATFFNNTMATRGGAIVLRGASYILVSQGTNMNFSSNSAVYQGGAIYNQFLEPAGSVQEANCFVKHVNASLRPDMWEEVTFRFNGNFILNGHGGPNAIHSTSTQPCLSNEHAVPLCWKGWEYDDLQNVQKYITTDANEELSSVDSAIIPAFPGWPVSIPVSIHDDLNNTVASSNELYFAIANNRNASVSTLDNFKIFARHNDAAVPVHFHSLGDRSISFNLAINLSTCPPGFVRKEADKSAGIVGAEMCKCQSNSFIFQCDSARRIAVLMGNHWMGMIDGGDYIIAPCPPHLCKISNFRIIPNDSSALNDGICKRGRRGVLCGECKQGFCLSVNSWCFDCIRKTGEKLATSISKYLSTVYVPYAALLLVVMVFHFKLTAGSLNGLVLFAQLITTTFDLTQHNSVPLKKSSNFFPKTYRFLYGAFNLDFIEKHISNFCFSSSLNTLSVLLLNYLLFIVPILIVIVVTVGIKISGHFTKKQLKKMVESGVHKERKTSYSVYLVGLSKPLRESIILYFSTVVLLSYTKLCITSAQILYVTKLVSMNGTIYDVKRVFIAGQVSEDGGYSSYQLPAVICAVYLSTLALLLLDYPLRFVEFLAGKVRLLRAVYPAVAISDFVCEFQICYKPKYKLFAGFYFIFRFAASLIFISGSSLMNRYVILELSCVVAILLLVMCKPYQNNTNNVIDIFIFANLAVINALNFYQESYFLSKASKHARASDLVFSIQYVLSMIPITCFVFCACVKLAIRHEPVRRQLQRVLLKVPKSHVLRLNNGLILGSWPKKSEDNAKEETANPSLIGKVRNEERQKEKRVLHCCSPDIPVTIIDVFDKGMGEAATSQSSLSEGYFLRTEWSSEREDYGTIAKQ